mgnify:CR=1 FL=1
MEFNCPTCQTRLRVSDELQNPKVRCRACGTIFRPLESSHTNRPQTAAQPSPYVSPSPSPNPFSDPVRQDASTPVSPYSAPANSGTERANRRRSSTPASPGPVISPRSSSGGKKGGGWGILFFILLMVLSRAPRLWRNLQAPPAPKPAPVRVNDDVMRQLQKTLDDTQRKQEEAAQAPKRLVPDEVELDDPNP